MAETLSSLDELKGAVAEGSAPAAGARSRSCPRVRLLLHRRRETDLAALATAAIAAG